MTIVVISCICVLCGFASLACVVFHNNSPHPHHVCLLRLTLTGQRGEKQRSQNTEQRTARGSIFDSSGHYGIFILLVF